MKFLASKAFKTWVPPTVNDLMKSTVAIAQTFECLSMNNLQFTFPI